jgi:thiol-disulfide isomerase/thioredoxin
MPGRRLVLIERSATASKRAAGLLALALALLAAPSVAGAFTFEDTQGEIHRLADYHGSRLVVNFWATWCPPCLREIPELAALHESNENIRVLGVALEYRDPGYVVQFAEQMLVRYPIVLGDARSASQVGAVRGLPTTYVYDPRGKVVAQQVGPVTRVDIERFVEKRSTEERNTC